MWLAIVACGVPGNVTRTARLHVDALHPRQSQQLVLGGALEALSMRVRVFGHCRRANAGAAPRVSDLSAPTLTRAPRAVKRAARRRPARPGRRRPLARATPSRKESRCKPSAADEAIGPGVIRPRLSRPPIDPPRGGGRRDRITELACPADQPPEQMPALARVQPSRPGAAASRARWSTAPPTASVIARQRSQSDRTRSSRRLAVTVEVTAVMGLLTPMGCDHKPAANEEHPC
jgi:hypothetical protein